MATIEIWAEWGDKTLRIEYEGKNGRVVNFDEATITAHSRAARNAIRDQGLITGPKRVTFQGIAPGPLTHVLKLVVRYKTSFHFKIGSRPFISTLAVQQAIDAVGVEPPQHHVVGHLITHITKHGMTPDDVKAVHTAYDHEGVNNRIWSHMVETLGYKFANNQFTDKESTEMITMCQTFPALDNAVINKMNQVKQRMQDQANRQAYLVRKDNRQSKCEETARHAEWKKAKRSEEQTQGLRPLHEEQVAATAPGGSSFTLRQGRP